MTDRSDQVVWLYEQGETEGAAERFVDSGGFASLLGLS